MVLSKFVAMVRPLVVERRRVEKNSAIQTTPRAKPHPKVMCENVAVRVPAITGAAQSTTLKWTATTAQIKKTPRTSMCSTRQTAHIRQHSTKTRFEKHWHPHPSTTAHLPKSYNMESGSPSVCAIHHPMSRVGSGVVPWPWHSRKNQNSDRRTQRGHR